jgi:Ca-activated chloride channel family protein
MTIKKQFAPDYYQRLQLHCGAGEKQIRAAYRLLARHYHPDVNPDETVRTRFLGIQEAYEILSDPEGRREYDEWLKSLPLEQREIVDGRQFLGPEALRVMDEPQLLTLLLDLRLDSEARPAYLPLNLCLVIDRSSSMRGDRLRWVRRATKGIIKELGSDDVFSLVTFSDRATIVLPAHRELRKEVAKSLVDAVKASGGTEIYQGLWEGYNQALRYHETTTLTHIILLTDGHTYGDVDDCLRLAKEAAKRNITISALGIGADWNDEFLDALTGVGHGTTSYITSPTEVPDSFQSQISRLRAVACRGATLILSPGEDVEIRGSYLVAPEVRELELAEEKGGTGLLRSQAPSEPGRMRREVTLGGLSFTQPTVIALELVVKAPKAGLYPVINWRLEVDLSPLGRGPERLMREVLVDVRDSDAPLPAVPEVVIAAQSRLTAFKLRQQAWQDMKAGRPQQAARRLRGVATRLLDLDEPDLAAAALEEAEHVARTGTLSKDRGKWIKYGTRLLALPAPGEPL